MWGGVLRTELRASCMLDQVYYRVTCLALSSFSKTELKVPNRNEMWCRYLGLYPRTPGQSRIGTSAHLCPLLHESQQPHYGISLGVNQQSRG